MASSSGVSNGLWGYKLTSESLDCSYGVILGTFLPLAAACFLVLQTSHLFYELPNILDLLIYHDQFLSLATKNNVFRIKMFSVSHLSRKRLEIFINPYFEWDEEGPI